MAMRSAFLQITIAYAWMTLAAAASEQTAPDAVSLQHSVEATVQQPRPFGYFIGDVLTQRVLLEAAGREFAPALPRAERVGVWFERRDPRIETADEDGKRWLVLEYQIVNAPRGVMTIELPSLEIRDVVGEHALFVPAQAIEVAPLTDPTASINVAQALRADRASPLVPTRPIWHRAIALGGACAAALAAWLTWIGWRNWLARRELPFARAWVELHMLDEHAPEAWQAVHRAFDRTAGRVVQRGTLAALFQAAPHFSPLRTRIEQFYAQSSALFFGAGLPDGALSVRELCRDLRRLERRHER